MGTRFELVFAVPLPFDVTWSLAVSWLHQSLHLAIVAAFSSGKKTHLQFCSGKQRIQIDTKILRRPKEQPAI